MSHNIMNETAYAGRKSAWHNLGVVLPEAKTMTELATAAGITWTYEKESIFYEVETLHDTFHYQIPGKAVILKSGAPPTPMGIVSDDYEYLQPREIQDSLDRLLEGTGWLPETALALGEGETTVYCIDIGSWSIGNDNLRDYLLVTDTVNGLRALQAAVTPVRTVCQNTLRLGLQKAQAKLNLVHKPGHTINYHNMIETIIKSQNNIRQALTDLSKVMMTKEEMEAKYKELFSVDPKAEGPKAQAIAVRMGEMQETAMGFARRMIAVEGLASTGWCWFNGASEALEHGGIMPSLSTRKSLTIGTGPTVEYLTRAYELVARS